MHVGQPAARAAHVAGPVVCLKGLAQKHSSWPDCCSDPAAQASASGRTGENLGGDERPRTSRGGRKGDEVAATAAGRTYSGSTEHSYNSGTVS
jgi:hypothetical protein